MKVVMCYPYVTPGMRGEVQDTLKTRWIGQYHKVDRFEEMFEKKFGIEPGHAVAVNSGTSALELAYDLIGLTKNDGTLKEVITTPLTCTATNIPLVRYGCQLHFCDIDKSSLCVTPSEIRKVARGLDNLRCVVVVSLAGIKAEIPDVTCPVVSDNCQALGIYDPKADFTAYSFQAIKHITTGDGGMLVCKDKAMADEAKLRRWFGIDRTKKLANNWQPYKNRAILFDIKYPGYKFQMTDIAAGMGIAGLREWEEILEQRKKIFEMYKREVKHIKGVEMIDGKENTYWLAGLLVDDRDSFSKFMMERGIETNVMHVRNDIYDIFKPFKAKLPNLDSIDDKYLYIPLHNRLTPKQVRYVIKTMHQWDWQRRNDENKGNKGRKAL